MFIEKEVLSSMTSPSVVKLLGSFHDNQYLYFVLEFCEGGELASYLKHNCKWENKANVAAADFTHSFALRVALVKFLKALTV